MRGFRHVSLRKAVYSFRGILKLIEVGNVIDGGCLLARMRHLLAEWSDEYQSFQTSFQGAKGLTASIGQGWHTPKGLHIIGSVLDDGGSFV
jgi:hypothetical protein